MTSRRLRLAPEERQRAFADAGDVLAPRLVGEEEAGRRVDDVVERGLVEAAGGGLFLFEVLGVEPGRHFLLDVRDVRPAEPGAVAVGPDRDVDRRVDAVRTGVPGVEHRPAALPRRRFLRPALAGRAPVGGDEVDVHADPLQELGRDVALPLRDRLVLRHDAGHRLVGVAADRKSTRLNSSHANISYAVFCLKKKKKKRNNTREKKKKKKKKKKK